MRNIQVRVTLSIFAIAILSSLLISLFSYQEAKTLFHQQFSGEFKKNAQVVSSQVDLQISLAAKNLEALAKNLSKNPHEEENNRHLFNFFCQANTLFYSVFFWNRNGDLLFAAFQDERDPTPYLNEKLYSEKSFLKGTALEVFKEKKPRFSQSFSPKSGLFIKTYLVPLIDPQGEAYGLLSAAIPINHPFLATLLTQFQRDSESFLLLCDPEGNILGKSPGYPIDTLTFPLKNLQKEGTLFLNQPKLKGNFLYFKAELEKYNLTLVSATPQFSPEKSLKKTWKNAFDFFLYSLFLSIPFSLWLGQSLTRPISDLINGLKDVGKGIYTTRVESNTSSELQEAIQAYNQMLNDLEKNQFIEKFWNDNWDA